MAGRSSALGKIQDAALRLFAEKGVAEVAVSDLARAAGVARGTIYNRFTSPETVFQELAARLAYEMHERVARSTADVADPAVRLSVGLRCFIRQAHEDPSWGRFVVRFAFSDAALRGVWEGQPAADLMKGFEGGRYSFGFTQLPSMLAMIAGAVLSAMFLVLEGHKTWREAGTDATEFVLRGLGVDGDEARAIAAMELPWDPR